MNGRDMTNLIILILIAVTLIFAVAVLMKKPRVDADWKNALSRVPVFTETAHGQFHLENFRTFEFAEGGKQTPGWGPVDLDVSRLKEMWFFVEPFPANSLFAHSFISFTFDDGEGGTQSIAVSIEARMEKKQKYSPLKGVFRSYELMYVWSTEKDILTRIGVGLDHTLYAYKLDLTDEWMRKLLIYFIRRTNTLAKHPRFYSTLHSNCTNELAKAVNEAFPKVLPWHRSWVMTGRSAKWLHKLGFIKERHEDTFRTLTSRANIHQIVIRHKDAPADQFDDLWRADFAAQNH